MLQGQVVEGMVFKGLVTFAVSSEVRQDWIVKRQKVKSAATASHSA